MLHTHTAQEIDLACNSTLLISNACLCRGKHKANSETGHVSAVVKSARQPGHFTSGRVVPIMGILEGAVVRANTSSMAPLELIPFIMP